MPITVSVDGLSIVTEKSEGKANATIPNVCKTPFPSPPGPLPLPYPNVAESKDLKGGSVLTKIDGGSVALFGSYIEKSTGDEPGSLGGVISGKTSGKAFFMNASSTVMIEGQPVCRKSDFMIMNEMNTVSMSGMSQPDVGTADEVEDLEEKTLEIELKDEKGNPLANEPYILKHSGNTIVEDQTNSDGLLKVKNVRGRFFKLSLPNHPDFERVYR